MYDSLNDALVAAFGPGVEVTDRVPASGSDLNEVWYLHLSSGDVLFLKTNAFAKWKYFTAEEAGLEALRSTGTVAVPHCFGCGTATGCGFQKQFSFLLMEQLESAPRRADFWETFAEELAEMHRAPTAEFVPGGTFGFKEDNVIGTTKQVNAPKDTWVDFFRENRLEFQFKLAYDYFGSSEKKAFDSVLNRLENLLPEPEYPSLLHGDLWGGNFMTGPDGKAWLIDPAVYVGHREADLAMTELFGGFSKVFYDAYFEAAAIPKDYRDRRDLYNLYHLLNHLNLFGRSYYGSVVSTIKKYA
ncbi:MAG: fructosamine kinase family protein [Clostridia bacterium]|nr:fructosamine kinase family protein [Clostridia bacterium]MBQ8469529.1 fructosamine kinase family protein [Clostridia bacterium]MBR1705071.1 fructosamine kinase family protein [Clostridia bacterium]